ncbi:hypothetical protein EG328_008289 [Venturia inaequalis]|uniref:Uncharacterized protein n=1 Tax=Venturia inaequalis TaxID=5025 RepID=A0A8H3YNM3_VENIN|nr:hypothetical protein EG328_008289 [Venturia inaequalis]
MATKRKSTSDATPAPRSPKRNREDSPIPTNPSSEPTNAFPILPQSTPSTLSISDKLLLKYLQGHGSEDPMYRDAIQLLLNSRLSFQFKPNRVLVAVGQTFEADAGVGDLLRGMPRGIKEEGIIFWIFSKLCKHVKSEAAVKEIVSVLLKGLPEVSSRAKILEDLAPELELETRFYEGGQEADITYAERDVRETQGIDDDIEEEEPSDSMTLKVEDLGTSLRLIPDKIDRCRALADIIRDAGLEAHDESRDSMMKTTGMLIETLLDTLGDTRTKTEVLGHFSLRAGVQLPKEFPDEGAKEDAESETVTEDEPETVIKDAYKDSPQPMQTPVGPTTPFERLETIVNSLDSDESRRHCIRRLAESLGLDFSRSEYPAETTTGMRAELDDQVGVPQPLRRQDNQDRLRQSPRRAVTACEHRFCDCRKPDEFPKKNFTKERCPIVELVCRVLNSEPQAEQAIVQRDTILAFLRKRVAGRNHGGGGDNSRRKMLDRALRPFIFANFPLFPELSDCIDLAAYGKPLILDNALHLRVDAIYPRVSPTGKTAPLPKNGRRQTAAAPKPPRGTQNQIDRFPPPRFEKPTRTRSFETRFSEPLSPYPPQSPLDHHRSGTTYDLFPARPPSSRGQQQQQYDPARCPTSPRARSVEGGEYRRWPPPLPFRGEEDDRVAPVAPMGPRY